MKVTYRNRFSNAVAEIEKTECKPYDGAQPQVCYRTWCKDGDGFLYHVSCFETMGDAKHDLEQCGFEV